VNFESFLHSFTGHVESIIQWLFLAILALAGFLISRGLLSRKNSDESLPLPDANNPELESMLIQILERTKKLETISVQGGMSPETVALAETQVQNLKKELSSREEEIKVLKASGGGPAVDPKLADEAAKLSSRLKELESKLAEYEILEDDIADLSLYKEENSRLRGELTKLKGGAPEAAPAAPAAASAPSAPASADIVAEFAQAVGSDTMVVSGEVPAPEVTMTVPDTGDPMKDFEDAVKIEKKMTGAPTPVQPQPAAAAPTAENPATDLFAEFADAPKNDDESAALDTDKMMAEMAALVSLEPAADSALDEGIDTEKMAAEAGSFGKR
jgi:hypothetical protein